MDKSSWGAGPWQSEPDRLQWTDPATGLVCLIQRAPVTGALCGYVGVPPGHRYHGAEYNEIDVEVHYGLTYAAHCDGDPEHGICHVPAPGEPDDVWWLGFDCSHLLGDVSPKINATLKDIGHKFSAHVSAYVGQEDVYRDIAYVRRECERLAAQISASRTQDPNIAAAPRA